jgi:predicted phage tail protein
MSLAYHPECVDLPIRGGMFEQAGLPAAAAIFAGVGIEHGVRVIRAGFAGLTAERRRRKQETQNNKQSYAFHSAPRESFAMFSSS